MIDELSMDGEFLSIFGKFKIPKIYEVRVIRKNVYKYAMFKAKLLAV